MKKALKIFAVVAAVLVVAVIGLTLFAKSYLTDERIRTLVADSAEKSLHRKVSLGAVSVSIFSGISVKDFAIREKDSDQAFLKADAFVLKYQLLPLLSKRLIIDELAVESPRIVIRRNADGSFNFSDMTRPKERAAGEKEEGGREVSGLPVNLSVKSLRIDKARLEYDNPAGTVKRAVVDLDAEVALRSGSDNVIGSSGNAKMTFVEVLLKDRPKPVKDMPLSVRYASEINLADRRIDISEASIAGMGMEASLKGRVNYGDPLSYAVEVKAPQVDLAAVQKSAAGFLPEGFGLGGTLSVDVDAEQKPEKDAKPTFKGEIVLRNAAVQTTSMRPVFSGTITLDPDRIGLRKVQLVAGDSAADITGQVLNYATNPDVRIDVSSAMLNLDSLMPAAGAAAGAGRVAKKDEKEFEPLKSKARAEGNVDIKQMIFKGVSVRNMKAHYAFRNNVFTLAPLTGSTLSGTFSVRTVVDLSKQGATYSMTAETKGLKLEEITAAFAPKAKENLFGALSGRADISGAGSVSASIKRNLKGKGSFSVRDGRIKNAQISEGLLAILGLRNLKEIPMEKAEGSFTIGGGTMNLKSVIANKDLVVDETGTIGLDQRLDISLLVKVSDALSPKIVSQSEVARFLSEEKGWTTVPLKLGGTIAKPSYGIDTAAVGRKATEKIQKKVGEELLKALSGEKGKKSEEQPEGAQQKKKGGSAEDLLKGFFK
jgi:AsmA protein